LWCSKQVGSLSMLAAILCGLIISEQLDGDRP
jgi:hypothetical protein